MSEKLSRRLFLTIPLRSTWKHEHRAVKLFCVKLSVLNNSAVNSLELFCYLIWLLLSIYARFCYFYLKEQRKTNKRVFWWHWFANKILYSHVSNFRKSLARSVLDLTYTKFNQKGRLGIRFRFQNTSIGDKFIGKSRQALYISAR